MKYRIFKLSLLLILLSSLIGCTKKEGISVENLNINNVSKSLEQILLKADSKNGVHIIEGYDGVFYLYITQYVIEQDNPLPYFENVEIYLVDDDIVINYDEKYTNDTSEALNNRVLFKITRHLETDTILIFKNGENEHIQTVWGRYK